MDMGNTHDISYGLKGKFENTLILIHTAACLLPLDVL